MKRELLGTFQLEDPNGPLQVSNILYERDRTTINSCQDGRYKTTWEIDETDRTRVRVYYCSDQKRAIGA